MFAQTQAQRARKMKISERRYNRIERGLEEGPTTESEATMGDLCALARRRHGLDLRATAALFGVTHVTLLGWERAGEPRLVAGWKRLGYRF
jgi:transcriptional regulator with XRE-family HTH domain